MKNAKQVTIYDIAKKIAVSPATVSRALKDHQSISKETIKLVKEAAKEMGYVPNAPASSLRSKKTHTIGVMVPWINRPFISTLISGIEEVANKEGYHVFISQSEDKVAKEIANAHALFSARVDGLIVSLAMETQEFSHFEPFLKSETPLVLVDRTTPVLASNKVLIDNHSAAFEATEHLISQGCKRIAHFSGAQHTEVYKQRKEGYVAALKKYQLPVEESLILYSDLKAQEGWEMTQRLLEMPLAPDAIFAANDTTAVSAIQCAKKLGLIVPDDLAIVGFNDDHLASIISPSLTTVSHPAFELGKIAASQLFAQQAKNEWVASSTTVLKTALIVRESSLRKG